MEKKVALMLLMVCVGLFSSPILSAFLTPIFCFVRKIFFVPLIQKKILDKAIEDGHVVTGRLKKEFAINVHDEYGNVPTNYEMGIYTYEYKGKKYKFRASSATELSDEITLYFQRNPRRATTSDTVGFMESNWLLYYFIICVISAVIVFIGGMIYGSTII